jgi:DNA end-binding protein Ku
MAATIWTGTLSFVLVSIPVELISALTRSRVSFNLVHKKDNSFLERRMFCPKDEKLIHGEHIVNGYEVAPEKYVVIRENEYKALEPKRSQSIEISSFADFSDVDPIYFDRPYYIMPRKGGSKSYQMLRQAMQETGKAGFARFVLHTREHLIVVKANEHILEMMTLHFSEQVKDASGIAPKGLKTQASHVKAMVEQIKKEHKSYDPDRYVDTHRKKVLDMLNEKARHSHTVAIREPEETETVEAGEEREDLISALEESLAKVRSK